MNRDFDVIVVGGGLSGCTTALAVARAGLSVCVVERGRRAGSKNVIGGILYTPILDRMFPKLAEEAPLERHVVSRSFSFLTSDSHVSLEVGSAAFDSPPVYNRSYTVRRTAFDAWLMQQVKNAGGTVLSQTVVDELIHGSNGSAGAVVGVRCGQRNGDLLGKVVILAEGANAILAESERLRPRTQPNQAMLGVKEVLQLDENVIASRFGLEGDAGRGFEFFGDPALGGFGSGFLYTNRDTLSVGLAASLTHLTHLKAKPYDLLDRFKRHPSVRPLLADAEPLEYCAHLLPVSASDGMPDLVHDGLLLVGDAARLANMSHHKELTNLVTGSALAAAETAVEAVEAGDTSAEGLAGYESRLRSSFVLKDLEKYSRLGELLEQSPDLLAKYPPLLVDSFVSQFTISERSKGEVEREILRNFNRAAKPAEFRRDLVAVLEACGFSLVPILKKAVQPVLSPSLDWLRLFKRRGRSGRK